MKPPIGHLGYGYRVGESDTVTLLGRDEEEAEAFVRRFARDCRAPVSLVEVRAIKVEGSS